MPIIYIFGDFSKYLGTLFVYDAYVREIPPIYCTASAARPAKSARPAKFQNNLIRDFSRIGLLFAAYMKSEINTLFRKLAFSRLYYCADYR